MYFIPCVTHETSMFIVNGVINSFIFEIFILMTGCRETEDLCMGLHSLQKNFLLACSHGDGPKLGHFNNGLFLGSEIFAYIWHLPNIVYLYIISKLILCGLPQRTHWGHVLIMVTGELLMFDHKWCYVRWIIYHSKVLQCWLRINI